MYHKPSVIGRYGRTPECDEHAVNYLKLLKLIISVSGTLSDVKIASLDQLMSTLSISDEVQKQVHAFDIKDVQVRDIVPALKSGGQLSRLLIRDRIELTHGIDSDEEGDALNAVAATLGVDEYTCASIQALVELERGAKRLHEAIFSAPT